jgi:coenzyme F420-0:L-glutamate ligase / coenzyme F420-1:gamma-L-glutamate ligase
MSVLSLSLKAVPGIPLINPEDDLAMIIWTAINNSDTQLDDGDIIVIAQKVVSKAENRIVDLDTVIPGKKALSIAKKADKDPRQVELILRESNEIVRCKEGVIIVEHRSGIVLANAGIDHSNVGAGDGKELVTLLPEDANLSAANLLAHFENLTKKKLAVIINDSVGRAWRLGTLGVAIGCAGILALKDLRGEKDLFDQELRVSETADADALACAACILMGEADDASPAVIISGFDPGEGRQNTDTLLRDKEDDMFR